MKNQYATGIALIIASMAAFAMADTLVKVSSLYLSPAQVLFFLTGGSLIVFALLAILQNEPLNDPRAFSPILLVRYSSEVIGMVGMVTALAYVPLSLVGAITQATPLLVALGAVLFLGEKVSWRRWTSIVVGFLGVLLVIQPSGEAFDVSVLWAVLAMVALSVRDLTTRLTPPGMPSSSLATYTMIAATPFAGLWVLVSGESFIPVDANWWVLAAMVLLGSLGYLLLIASIRTTEVSVVMPFRYTRILFLLVLGIFVFDENPSTAMYIGVTLIIASGVYMMWRERRVKQETGR